MDTRSRSDGVVVGVNGSRTAMGAVGFAATEARLRRMPLRIVHAAPYAVRTESPGTRRTRDILGVAYTLARRLAPDVAVSTRSSRDQTVPALIDASQAAQLLVVGMGGGEGLWEALPTSVALDVAGRAACPVAVVRGRYRAADEPVLVGIGDADADEQILATAFAEAERHRCGLVVLHAHHTPLRERVTGPAAELEAQARIAAAIDAWAGSYPSVDAELRTSPDTPAGALLAAAHTARFVVMGTHARGAGSRVLFGCHSRAVLRRSPVPVLVVDPDVVVREVPGASLTAEEATG